jgi:hypothetical protein
LLCSHHGCLCNAHNRQNFDAEPIGSQPEQDSAAASNAAEELSAGKQGLLSE